MGTSELTLRISCARAKPSFFGHHHVKDADVVFAFEEGFVSAFAIGEKVGAEAFLLEVFSEKHTEAFVVFAEKDACTFVHSCVSF